MIFENGNLFLSALENVEKNNKQDLKVIDTLIKDIVRGNKVVFE